MRHVLADSAPDLAFIDGDKRDRIAALASHSPKMIPLDSIVPGMESAELPRPEQAAALAKQTGLGSSFFGAVFVAISTSLPEISTVLAAVRLGRYVMAVSDIFGTNIFDIAVIFIVDLLFLDGPVLNHVGTFSIFAGLLGILVTALYLVGLVERRDPVVLGVGLDTLAVTITYLGGIALLYGLR